MENVSVQELRVEAKGLGLERYSKRKKAGFDSMDI